MLDRHWKRDSLVSGVKAANELDGDVRNGRGGGLIQPSTLPRTDHVIGATQREPARSQQEHITINFLPPEAFS